MSKFGPNHIRNWRLSRGLSQVELAKRIGVSKSEMSRLEGGGRSFTVSYVNKIAEALDIDPRQILDEPPMGFDGRGQVKRIYGDIDTPQSSTLFSGMNLSIRAPGFEMLVIESDDMLETLKPGDIAVIDRNKAELSSPGLYAIAEGKGSAVKRIQPLPGGKLVRLSCDNPSYEAVEASRASVKIVGRVVARIQKM